jgi:hypothetical protein
MVQTIFARRMRRRLVGRTGWDAPPPTFLPRTERMLSSNSPVGRALAPTVEPGRTHCPPARNQPGRSGESSPSVQRRAQTVSGRALGGIAVGNVVLPDSQVSTPAAQDRPSAIAQTISDCPRPASPATNTPGTLLM